MWHAVVEYDNVSKCQFALLKSICLMTSTPNKVWHFANILSPGSIIYFILKEWMIYSIPPLRSCGAAGGCSCSLLSQGQGLIQGCICFWDEPRSIPSPLSIPPHCHSLLLLQPLPLPVKSRVKRRRSDTFLLWFIEVLCNITWAMHFKYHMQISGW